jgi:uncharacterized caspase-like protein
MGTTLRGLGFTIALQTNVNQKQMKQAIREFSTDLRKGGAGLFYFAGHGVQSKGKNFLIPVGVNIDSEAELEDQAVDLALILNSIDEAKNRVNLVILDACRNNPFARSFRSGVRGLAQIDTPGETLIAFATAPGSVALDGVGGRNGVYTKHLLESLLNPESDVERVFKRVRKAVYQETSGRQIPWESSSLIGDFTFQLTAAPVSRRAPAAPSAPAIDPVRFDLAFWNEIKDRNNPDELRAYLEQYPNGRFATLARTRLSQAAAAAVPVAAAAVPVLTQDAANTMLGTWDGYYGYREGRMANVPFKLTITSTKGQGFAGLISEPATFGDGSSPFLFAHVRGTIAGSRIQFVKTYDGTGGERHSVKYEGMLESGASRLKGGWAIEQQGRIVNTGFFEASQP